MQRFLYGLSPALVLGLMCSMALGQSAVESSCTLDAPVLNTSAANIFNAQQEQDLADALAEYWESGLQLAAPGENDRLTLIGEKLLAVLPPSGLHYRFRIYDSGEVNGFSIGGGRVYISRKLVAATKNEDELAGVLAHEIGHIATHQTAIDMTRIFRIRLGVTQVTDRADIFAKVHRMLSTPAKSSEAEDTEKKDQLAADHVALYAVVRAGYSPESFASFLNESMLNKGKTGNWVSDFFGMTREASQRYRSALKLIAALPAGCKSKEPVANTTFTAWQKSVVEERVKMAVEGVAGDKPLKLDPPLRPSLWRIRFSPDGRYVLAQDEGGISVVDRAAAKVLFRIDAPDVEAAQFTPNSQSVVFHDAQLRVEQWNVAAAKRDWVKEMVVLDGCTQTRLSPDGKTLICARVYTNGVYPKLGLRLIDVASGQPFYDQPRFIEPEPFSPLTGLYEVMIDSRIALDVASMVVSPDGRFLIVAVANHAIAFNLVDRSQIALGGKLHNLTQTRMDFVGPDQLFVVGDFDGKSLYHARILSFPDGRILKETIFGDGGVNSVSKGQLLVTGPLKDYPIALYDPNKQGFIAESKQLSMDAWDDAIAVEDSTGALMLENVSTKSVVRIPLPLGKIPRPKALSFSKDGKFLALSLKNRASIWDISTGKQVGLIRPFRSAWMTDEDHLIGQFPKFIDRESTELDMSLAPFSAKVLTKYEDDEWQYRDMQYHFKPMGKDKSTNRHATLEIKKMGSTALAWSRDYPQETPAFWQAEDNRMVFAWDLSNDAVKGELKSYPALQKELEALKDHKKGLLLETVVPETGAPLQQVVLPEADISRGWNDSRRAVVSGGVALVHGEHGNTAIYRLDTGVKVGEFFGSPLATDAGLGLIAAVNREDEILLVDEHSAKERGRFSLGSPVRAARILSGKDAKDKILLVLTADQVMHRLPLPE